MFKKFLKSKKKKKATLTQKDKKKSKPVQKEKKTPISSSKILTAEGWLRRQKKIS